MKLRHVTHREIAREIARCRREAGYSSQEKLAEALAARRGVKVQSVRRRVMNWEDENTTALPDEDYRVALIDLIGLSPAVFVEPMTDEQARERKSIETRLSELEEQVARIVRSLADRAVP